MADDGEEKGQGEPRRISRSEMVLLRRAKRERWGVPDEVKTEALSRVAEILMTGKAKTALAAARTLVAFEQVDQGDDRLEIERRKLELVSPPDVAPSIADVMKSMEDAAARYGDDGDEAGLDGGDGEDRVGDPHLPE